MVSVPAHRSQVTHATRRGISQRRACTLMKVSRSALNYSSKRTARDAPVIARMREIAGQYPRYGYRRIRIFLGREGYAMSNGRMERLWRQARLQVPRKRPRRRVASDMDPVTPSVRGVALPRSSHALLVGRQSPGSESVLELPRSLSRAATTAIWQEPDRPKPKKN
jgi:hypothetical protein